MKFKTIASLVATPIVLMGSGFMIANSVDNFVQEEEKYLPYVQLAGTQSMGSQWLEDFLSNQPFGGENSGDVKKWGQTSTVRTLIADESIKCVEPQPMPPYVLDAKTASNGVVSISAVTTQAGMSKSLIDSYESRASDCKIELHRNEDGSRVDIADDTSLLFYGDVAVSVNFSYSFSGNKESIVSQVEDRIKDSLETFRCTNINTHVEDRRRNIYYTVDNEPVGKFQTDTVETEEDAVNLPTLVDATPAVMNYPNLVKPEAPYPADFPDIPKRRVEQPDIPPLPQITGDTFKKDVTYEVPDFEGAGCGWDWSAGQDTPIYDVKFLEKVKEDKKKETLSEVNANAREYISSYLNTLGSRATVQPRIIAWNNYVDAVNEAHISWIELENARNAIKAEYDAYIEAWSRWATFDRRKEAYEEFYDKEVEFCKERDNKFLSWQREEERRNDRNNRDRNDDNLGESTPAPAVCGDIVEPEILNQRKGDEPNFVPPEGVTIPHSWKAKDDVDQNAIVNELKEVLENDYANLVNRIEEADRQALEQQNRERREERSTAPSTTARPEPSESREPSIVERIEGGEFTPEIPDITDLLP